MVPPPPIPDFTLLWSDPFTGSTFSAPDAANWNVIATGPNFGNNEVQTYTASTNNASVSGRGSLCITPQKDQQGNWTSARLESVPSFGCQPGGKMVLQAELQTGTASQSGQQGIWPAFWALGQSFRGTPRVGWPECGEWDIMENAHGVPWTLASLHYSPDQNPANERSVGGQVGSSAQVSFLADAFNTFTLTVDRTPSTWQEESLTWSLNGKSWFVATGAQVGDETMWANCAQKPYFAILNVAVGSNFPNVGGRPDDATVSGLGSGMQVNYVAFYASTAVARGKEGEVAVAGGGGGGGVAATTEGAGVTPAAPTSQGDDNNEAQADTAKRRTKAASQGPTVVGTTPIQAPMGMSEEQKQKKGNRLSRIVQKIFK